MDQPRLAMKTRWTSNRGSALLPVSKARLRGRLILRLLLAFPAGLIIAAIVIAAFGLESSAARTVTFSGLALSYAAFLFTTWRLGVRRRAAFAAAGGDPQAAGVLLFGVMKPRSRANGSRSGDSGFNGYFGDGDSSHGGGDSGGGDSGGGDGGGGGGD
ncbi:hypothetical protein ACVLB3_004251 [Pseudarthrobacter sp. PvP022]